MDIEGFRKAGYAAVDAICDYYRSLSEQTVKAQVQPGYLLEQLPNEAPTNGEPFEAITDDFKKLILPGITHWQHGKFFAYFPSISTFESMIADLYATSVTMDWMAKILGLEDAFRLENGNGGGVILNSASEAALTAAICAREAALRQLAAESQTPSSNLTEVPDDIRATYTPKLVMYGSTQTHSLGTKAALILGMTFRAVAVSSADGYSLRGEALKAAMQEDIDKGLVPFFVIATVGTTSTGAIDRIDEIGKLSAVLSYPTVSLHIDAAWAGVALALDEHRIMLRLEDINRFATSFCTNMHKWGLVAFDCSLFFVRDRRALNLALDATPAFLRSKEADAGAVIDYRNWQLALGRRFRSIKIWFVMRSYGVKGFQAHLRAGIEQCNRLAEIIDANLDFELVSKPSLALLVFRLGRSLPGGTSPAELNLLNTKLNNRLIARYDLFLTQTMLHSMEGDIFCIRFAMGGKATTMKDVEEVWAAVCEEGKVVLDEWREQGPGY